MPKWARSERAISCAARSVALGRGVQAVGGEVGAVGKPGVAGDVEAGDAVAGGDRAGDAVEIGEGS